MYVKFQRFCKACLTGCLTLGLLASGSAGAAAEEPQLHIQAQPGLGTAKVQEGAKLPVRFTLSNTGANLEGDLVVRIGQGGGSADFSYKQHVELPQGGTKTVTMLLPGKVYAKNSNHIAFYEHSAEDGREVALSGDTEIEATVAPAGAFRIGVLAPAVDTLNFLVLLDQQQNQVEVLHLQAADLPADELVLNNLDMLAINDFASDTLKLEQVQAIGRWVEQGGQLLLAGGAGFPKTAGPFAELSPVTYSGTAAVTELGALAEAGGKPLALTEPFTISLARPAARAVVDVRDSDHVLAAHQSRGRGTVRYMAYDLSLNPLASWNGNTALWQQLLAGQLPVITKQVGGFPSQSFWQLDTALEYFPQLKPPKLSMLSLVLLIYALLVGPLLYWLLRRWDKREWAWAAIPALALLTSIGIFQLGISSRGSTSAQALHTVELDGAGSGVKRSALALFLPKGGSPQLDIPGAHAVQPLSDMDISSSKPLGTRNGWMIEQSGQGAAVKLHGVPYSSISKMTLDSGQLLQAGTLDFKLKASASDKLSGEVTNNTKQQLQDVGLIVNNKWLSVGDLGPGAKANVEANGGTYISDPSSLADLIFPSSASQDFNLYVRERALLVDYLGQSNANGQLTSPVVFGFVHDNGSAFTVNGGSVPTEQISLWAQPVTLDYVGEDGSIFVPDIALQPLVTEISMTAGTSEYRDGQRIHMGSGQMTFEYRLPDIPNAQYRRMQLKSEPNSLVKLQLWNAQTAAWEPVEPGAELTWEGDKVTPYVQEGKIRMQAATAQSDVWLTFPTFSLEGAVQR